MTVSPPDASNLANTHLRLRPDCSIEALVADASFWPRLIRGELGDFKGEYLVTCSTHETDWSSWEVHPNGDEIVCLISGAATLLLETATGNTEVPLRKPGDFAFVPRGTWHTALTRTATTLLFITAGEGTRTRPADTATRSAAPRSD